MSTASKTCHENSDIELLIKLFGYPEYGLYWADYIFALPKYSERIQNAVARRFDSSRQAMPVNECIAIFKFDLSDPRNFVYMLHTFLEIM